MTEAKSGDTVLVHYTGRLADGTQFDSSDGRDPLEFTLGQGQVIAGFEQAVTGMTPGDSQQVHIEPAEAYGERADDLVFQVPRENFPDDLDIAPGMRFRAADPGGNAMPVTVTEVADGQVTVDANPPLAGQVLTFDISLVEIKG
ncbi:MAG: peptidylprolyl isomerase [Alphaproteobacteria bacterium]